MKKSYIGFSLILLVFGVYVVRNFKHHLHPRAGILDTVKADLPTDSGLSYLILEGNEKKIPNFIFTDQNNQIITNVDYKDKVYVIEFFFTTCPTICPIMNKNMRLIDDQYANNPNFGIASITINPEIDTPIKLKEYAEHYGVKSLNWHFLTGKQEDILNFSNKGLNIFAGINPKVSGGFEHQGYFALVDKNGYIRSRKDKNNNPIVFYQGTNKTEVQQLIKDIALLLKNE